MTTKTERTRIYQVDDLVKRILGGPPRDGRLGWTGLAPLIGGLGRGLIFPFLTPQQQMAMLGIAPIMGAAREADLQFLANVSVNPIGTITSDTTLYFTCPRPFLYKGTLIATNAAADFTTGDESLAISSDYSTDGTTWVAVVTEATNGGAVFGSQFPANRTRVFPATVAASLITADYASEVNVRVPGNSQVRVVLNVAGTTPVFTAAVAWPFGIFLQ